MRFLKQSTSVDLPIGPFLDTADGFTALSSLTLTQPDIRLKKNGGDWAQKNASQTLSHEENGYYEVTLDSTDTDTLGCLRLAVNESSSLPVWEEFMVMPANIWDSLFGSDLLNVNVMEWLGFEPVEPNTNGVPAVEVVELDTDVLSEIGTSVWETPVDGAVTAQESLRLANAANGGILAGAATTNITVRDLADSKDRIDATVDANGNRTAVTLDLT